MLPSLQHDVPAGTQPFQIQPHGFTKTPSNPVAEDTAAERFGGGEAHPGAGLRFILSQAEGGKVRAGKADPLLVDALEVRAPKEPRLFRKRKIRFGQRTGVIWRSVRLSQSSP